MDTCSLGRETWLKKKRRKRRRRKRRRRKRLKEPWREERVETSRQNLRGRRKMGRMGLRRYEGAHGHGHRRLLHDQSRRKGRRGEGGRRCRLHQGSRSRRARGGLKRRMVVVKVRVWVWV